MMNEQMYIHISSHSNINLINASKIDQLWDVLCNAKCSISVHNHNLYVIRIKFMNIEGCNVKTTLLTQRMPFEETLVRVYDYHYTFV